MSGRGSTGTNRAAGLPLGLYEPPPTCGDTQDGLIVAFHGEDGRTDSYRVDQLPLPGWHRSLAAALSASIGPAGRRRTQSSARCLWLVLGRLLRFLATTEHPPAAPAALTSAHLEGFRTHRASSCRDGYAWSELQSVRIVFECRPLCDLLAGEVMDYLGRRGRDFTPTPKPGYSDNELRRLVGAARSDVAMLRDRIDAGRRLLTRYHHELAALSPAQRQLAETLVPIEATGVVPTIAARVPFISAERRDLAAPLFLTLADLTPLLVLFVAVTGWNAETIKELPAQHRILDNRAVEVRLVKRRRGARHWFSTVTWEIGAAGRELHTPGGLYLLLHRLTAPGRALVDVSPSVWSVWRNGSVAGVYAALGEHHNPFAKALRSTSIHLGQWAKRHALSTDPPDSGTPMPIAGVTGPRPLSLDLNRIKTSVDVRRTRQMGGHLPSAARTNGIPVLFRNYLRGDPTAHEWARQIVDQALIDAEQSALAAHHQALARAGGGPQIIPETAAAPAQLDDAGLTISGTYPVTTALTDTAWAGCVDHDHHPSTGKPCRDSFLVCFQCRNCVITGAHLPRLLGLLDALAKRREQLSQDEWWSRYGMAWAAIRHDVLAKFSPAEITQATADKTTDALLDLVENPWEQP